jgi:hypothetical protein
MNLNREHRRTAAHFLNGLAVALLAALVLTPLASGTLDMISGIGGLLGAGGLHGAAMLLASAG